LKSAYVILLATALTVFSGQTKDQTMFTYHVWGTVVDSDGHTMTGAYVCIIPSVRPINGRIPCTRTTSDGSFAITIKDIPDEYKVCASTKESPFILLPNPDPSHRVVCSDSIPFPAHDDCRKIDLKFDSKNESP
jgi:hypothetical protein